MTKKEIQKIELIQIDVKVTFNRGCDEGPFDGEVLEVESERGGAPNQHRETIGIEQLLALLKPLLRI
jgi:hypothetical protein